ncbi:hypothetical protein MC885_013980 [Smutsia gigantea]|nr:hypothetical protein MC885_013980 [Smutsia gigantea]
MIQGTSEPAGSVWGWGWDGDDDGDDDGNGTLLTLLALVVVAATALALHWLGSGQDQEAAGPASTAPGQAGGAGPALPPKAKVSGGIEGHSSELGKPEPPGCSQGGPTAAGAQDQEPPGGRGLATTVTSPLKTPGKVAGGRDLGQQCGSAIPETLRARGREPFRPGASLLGRSKAGGTSAPLLIHFTLRSPGREIEKQVEAGELQAKVPGDQAPIHAEEQDTTPWHQGVRPPGSLGRDPGSQRRQVDNSSGARTYHSPKRDPLRLGTVVSVWDPVDATSSLSTGIQRPPSSQVLPPSHIMLAGPLIDGAEWGSGKESPQPAPVLILGSGAEAASAPVTAPAPTSRPGLTYHEPSGALCKGKQEGQISASWGNLISMVLRSHPFPRQEGPQGTAPRAAPESPRDPSTFALSENRESGSLPEGAVPSLKDSHSSAKMVPGTGTGGLAEAGCQPHQKETPSASTPGLPTGPRGDGDEEKHPAFLLPQAAMPRAPSPSAEPAQPGPAPSPTARPEAQPVPRPRKHSMCRIAESSEWEVSQAAARQHQGETTAERPSSVGSRRGLTEKQKEAQKLMVFLQRPQSWGVVEGPRRPSSTGQEPAPGVALQRRLELGSCLDILAFAQQHREPCLAQKAYALMSDNLLRVLGDPSLYRQLSGADRERILSLRTGRGQAVLGVLVLPSLYQMSCSGPTRGPPGEEAPVVGPVPLPPCSHVHMFNPRENTWRHLTQVPEKAPLRGCGLCTMHNYLFLAGGIRGSGAKATCSNEVFCYNPLTNIWSQMQPMQQARAQLKLVALDGLLYAIGGECLYSMERYDPRTDAWTSRAPLPAGTFPVAHEAVACHGDIYVTGGHLFYRLLRYSPVKDTWDERPYSASHRRSSDMVALGGFLYRFDLLRGVGAAVMRYNTVTGSWSRAALLPLPDPAPLRCAVLDNTIYCLSHQVTATLTVSEGTAEFQAKELQPFPLGNKGVLCPFILTLPSADPLQTAI